MQCDRGDLWAGVVSVHCFDGSPESREVSEVIKTGAVFLPTFFLHFLGFLDPLSATLGSLVFLKARLGSKSPIDSPPPVPLFDCLPAVIVPVWSKWPSMLPLVGRRTNLSGLHDAVV